VNVEALEKLESEGKKIYPKPSAIRTIKNKISQKQFYKQHEIPTSEFVITESREQLNQHKDLLPAVHKIGEGGYDGKGVQIIKTANDISLGFDAPAVLEKMVIIRKEIAVIVAVNDKGESAIYPPVEMFFDQDLNLLDFQVCPAEIPERILWKVEAIALKTIKEMASPGLFAVEMFINDKDEVIVNETAPRVHNSGHHTIEAHYSSQYDMLWRVILGFPLGNTDAIKPSAIVNILGAQGHNGVAKYEGLDEVLTMDNAFVHLYGKQSTKPGRKMGHVTVLSDNRQELKYYTNKIKHTLKVISE